MLPFSSVAINIYSEVYHDVTEFAKTIPNYTFGISRFTSLNYCTHYGSLVLYCSNVIVTV